MASQYRQQVVLRERNYETLRSSPCETGRERPTLGDRSGNTRITIHELPAETALIGGRSALLAEKSGIRSRQTASPYIWNDRSWEANWTADSLKQTLRCLDILRWRSCVPVE